MCRIMSLANSDSFMSSLPIWIPLISFFFSDALSRKLQTMLNESGESRHPYLVPDLRGNAFSFSPLSIMLAVGLSYMLFIILKYVLPMPTLQSFFLNHKWLLNFFKSFLCIYWDDHTVFILQFVNVYIIPMDLQILKSPCILGINPTWSWCIILLMYCWMQFASILLQIFVPVFIGDIAYNFLCHIFVWFRYQGDHGFIKWVLEYYFLCRFFGMSSEG